MSATKNIPNGRAMRFMLSYMVRYLPSIVPGILLLMTVDTLQLIIPRIVKRVLDTLGEEQFSSALIVKFALTIVALAVAMTVVRFLYRMLLFLPSRKIEKKMRDDLFGDLLHLPVSFFNVTKTGDLMALFINDINAVRMTTGMVLIAMTDALFMGTMSLAFMMAIDVRLTLVAVAPLPVIALLMIRFGGIIQKRFTAVQESFGHISSQVQEAFSGVRAVKGFVQECAELKTFSARCGEYVEKNMRLVKVWGILFPLISLFGSFSIGLLFLYGGRQVVGGNLSLGSFVSFAFYIQLFLWPIMAIGWVYNMLQRGIASAKRLLELSENEPERTALPRCAATVGGHVRGHIVMRNLTFRFNAGGREVLHGIDLDIPAGGSLGVIGKPGAGKTTLVSLLFNLFPVERGHLFIDDIDINDMELTHLRKSIGYVPQDSFLFSDTIERNITFGFDEQTVDRALLQRAARTAAIEKDMALFPGGYETVVGERGITLSGGQKQRISIARAIILQPSILILDDALSSIDAGTEREVLTALKNELRGRTSLIIAHRISTVRGCDSIIVLDNGIVAERGNHAELVAQGGFYARLNALQSLQTGRR